MHKWVSIYFRDVKEAEETGRERALQRFARRKTKREIRIRICTEYQPEWKNIYGKMREYAAP